MELTFHQKTKKIP